MSSTQVLDRVFDPITRCLTPDVAQKIADLRADDDMQRRITELAEKANEGELTSLESAEYEELVRAIRFMTLLQAKARRVIQGLQACP